MSVLIKEEGKSKLKEKRLKEKLKSKLRFPREESFKLKRVSISGITMLKPETDIATVLGRDLKRWGLSPPKMSPKPVATEVWKPSPKRIKRQVNITLKPTVTKIDAQKAKEVNMETRPKIPKIEVKKLNIPKLETVEISKKLSTSTIQPPKVEVKALVKQLTRIESGPIMKTVYMPPRIAIKSVLQAPRVVEREELIGLEAEEERIAEEFVDPGFLKTLGGVAKPLGRPICIILPKTASDSYVYSVALICREIYRIVKGGYPEPRWLSKGSKEEIERWMKAMDTIFIIDDSKCEMLPVFNKVKSASELHEKIRKSKLFDRLRELFSQGYGFIIFHIGEKFKNEFMRMLSENVGSYVEILELSPRGLLREIKEELTKVCWGFVDAEGRTFDELFGSAEKKYYEELSRMGDNIKLQHFVKKDPNASPEHEHLKAFVVEAVAREMGAKSMDEVIQKLKQGEILTEYTFDGGRADVYVKSTGRYLEVETFYGTGDPIVNKLDKETLAKYRRGKCVDIVVLGLHALLYAKKLFRLAKVYKEDRALKVNFYVPDFKERRLVPLRDLLSRLNQLGLYPHEDMDFDQAKKAYEHLEGRELSEKEVAQIYFRHCEENHWKIPSWVLKKGFGV